MKNLKTLKGEKVNTKVLEDNMMCDGQGSGSTVGEFLLDGEKITVYKHWSNHSYTVNDFKTTFTTTLDGFDKNKKWYEKKYIHGANAIGELHFYNYKEGVGQVKFVADEN